VLDDEGRYVGEHWRVAMSENDYKEENPNAQKMDVGTTQAKSLGEKVKAGLVTDGKKCSGGISNSCHTLPVLESQESLSEGLEKMEILERVDKIKGNKVLGSKALSNALRGPKTRSTAHQNGVILEQRTNG